MKNTDKLKRWKCPKCSELHEIENEICWKCQYERQNDEPIIEVESEIVNEDEISKKEVPRTSIILNILVALSIIGYFQILLQTLNDFNITVLISVIIPLSIGLVGLIALIWMRKWGLLLYTLNYVIGFISCFENPIFFIYQVVPTIIIIWGYYNYRKFV